MDTIKISQFLRNLDQNTKRGICIACETAVQWSTAQLGSHKSKFCPNISEDEQNLFGKKSNLQMTNVADSSMKSQTSNDTESVILTGGK